MKLLVLPLLFVPLLAVTASLATAQTPPPPLTGVDSVERPAARQARNVTRVSVWNMPASPDRVFPLLCPVLEYDWIPWWRAEMIHSVSGVAEENCIFRTNAGPAAGLTWICTRYEPNQRIEYTCFAPDKFIVRLKIVLLPTPTGTRMEWTRSWLSIGVAGDEGLAHWSPETYDHMMATHEREMAQCLRSGPLPRAATP